MSTIELSSSSLHKLDCFTNLDSLVYGLSKIHGCIWGLCTGEMCLYSL